jgi:RNA polymerase sigma-70 factor (ECF subfamily)
VKTNAPSFFTRRRAASAPAPGVSPPGVGDPQSFRNLVLPHLDGAYNLARYLTRDPVLSEDVVQDAVLRAYRAFGQYRGGSARAWLFMIVRNCCRTAHASASANLSLVVSESSFADEGSLAEQPDPAPRTRLASESRSTCSSGDGAVESIPEPFREAVVLRDLEELSYAEIAEVTGVPVGTVMSRLSRGRAMLAKQLLPASSASGEPSRSVK